MQEIPHSVQQELQTYSDNELLEVDIKHLISEIKILEENLKTIKPNLTAIKVSVASYIFKS